MEKYALGAARHELHATATVSDDLWRDLAASTTSGN
jgi:hypothetical protein